MAATGLVNDPDRPWRLATGPVQRPVYHARMKKPEDKRPAKAKALPAWMPDSLRGSDAQAPKRAKPGDGKSGKGQGGAPKSRGKAPEAGSGRGAGPKAGKSGGSTGAKSGGPKPGKGGGRRQGPPGRAHRKEIRSAPRG